MAVQNSINKKTTSLTIDPGVALGDSFVQFTDEFIIGVNDTDDSFRISTGNDLSTNNTFIMSDAGARVMPLQPAFLTIRNNDVESITGDGTDYMHSYNLEIYDQGSDMTDTTFIASVTGKFKFNFTQRIKRVAVSHTSTQMKIVTSNRTYRVKYLNPFPLGATSSLSATIFTDMDISDTTTFHLIVSGGTKIIDIWAGGLMTKAVGFLVC